MAHSDTLMGSGKTILLVDDDLVLTLLLTDMLESFGFAVLSVQSGAEAEARVEQGLQFDVLLTDVSLHGGINGFELARRIDRARPATRIIFSSGSAWSKIPDTVPKDAVFLPKPASIDALKAVLSEVLLQ